MAGPTPPPRHNPRCPAGGVRGPWPRPADGRTLPPPEGKGSAQHPYAGAKGYILTLRTPGGVQVKHYIVMAALSTAGALAASGCATVDQETTDIVTSPRRRTPTPPRS